MLNINQMIEKSCSEKSLRQQAEQAQLINVINSDQDASSIFIWQYLIEGTPVVETDNTNGVYCLYE